MRMPSLEDIGLIAVVGLVIMICLPDALAVSNNDIDVTYRLRTGRGDVSFDNPIEFTQIQVEANKVTFDSVSFGIEKVPASGSNLIVAISAWTPAVQTGTAIEFVGAALLTTHDIYFNISGLQSLSYDVKVNGATQATLAGPTVSFLWSNWNAAETIAFVVDPPPYTGPTTPGGPGLPSRPDSWQITPYDWRLLGILFLVSTILLLAVAFLIRGGYLRRSDLHFRSRLTVEEMRRLRAAGKVIMKEAERTVSIVKQPIRTTRHRGRPKRMRWRRYRTR